MTLLDRALFAYWAARGKREAREHAVAALYGTSGAVFFAATGEHRKALEWARYAARAGADAARSKAIEITARLGLAMLPEMALEGR